MIHAVRALVRTAAPAELSRSLRADEGRFLRLRRAAVSLQMMAAGSMGIIALYQLGILRHLPEPPLPMLDADRVDASSEAYARFSVGDAYLGFASYATTMLLAAAGPADRHRRLPWLPLATAVKAAADAAEAARLTRDQWARHRAFCSWCLLAASATFATLIAVAPEARAAWRSARARRRIRAITPADTSVKAETSS